MNIEFASTDLLSQTPSIQIYGPPGVGKTLAVGISIPEAAWIVSQPTNLRPLASWCKWNWDTAKHFPRTPIRPKAGLDCEPAQRDPNNPDHWEPRPVSEGGTLIIPFYRFQNGREVQVQRTLDAVTDEIARIAAQAGINAVAYDEMSEFARWMDGQKPAGFGGVNILKDAIRSFAQRLQAAGVAPIYIAHQAEPIFEGGKLVHIGGPEYPIKNMRAEMPKLFDICVRMFLARPEDEGDEASQAVGSILTRRRKVDTPRALRLFQTEGDELYVAKMRDCNPDIKPIESRNLRTLLRMAGMRLPGFDTTQQQTQDA